MPIDVQDRFHRPATLAQHCAVDGMPLYPTIVGPRCPLCGAATGR
jgi:uncharacterized Zn finger protein (UPF0148 family)